MDAWFIDIFVLPHTFFKKKKMYWTFLISRKMIDKLDIIVRKIISNDWLQRIECLIIYYFLIIFLQYVHRFKCYNVFTFKIHCNIPTLETESQKFFKLPPVHYCISWSLISERPNEDDQIGAVNVLHVYLTFQSPCLFLSP